MAIKASAFFEHNNDRISAHVYPTFDTVIGIILFVFFYPIFFALIYGLNTSEIRINNKTILKTRWNFKRIQELNFVFNGLNYKIYLNMHKMNSELFVNGERIQSTELEMSQI